jgi:putative addiction module killer protein
VEIRHYLSPTGRDPFQRWLDGLRDLRCRVAVLRRIDRLAAGNPGDVKHCQDGVWELRVDCGPGYRVYFSRPARDVILLLRGGSKRTQTTDVTAAVTDWHSYKENA